MPENWDDFKRSDHPANLRLRRVDPRHPLDFFYGKDFHGNYVFTFRGRLSGEMPNQPKQLAGIDVVLDTWGDEEFELRLRLHDSAQADIFKALCANLMSATERLGREQHKAGIEIILRRLARWQELLKSRIENLLSKSQVIGLWGELLFFSELFLEHLPPHEALAAWRGPFGDEQDFILANWLTEVKTQLSSSDRKIQISSAEQLDTVSGQIFICHQVVGPSAKDDPLALSLNDLVEKVMVKLAPEDTAVDILRSILIEFGYMRRAEYDLEKWVLNERSYYQVVEGFPAIKASELASGIADVKYCIRIESIIEFMVAENQFTTAVFGQNSIKE